MYLVIGKVTPEKVLHEFAHAIVRAIAAENPTLFVSLYNELASTAEGQEIIQDIRNLYPNMEFKDKLQFMEEAIVTSIGQGDIEIERCKHLIAICQTARQAYINDLGNQLSGEVGEEEV